MLTGSYDAPAVTLKSVPLNRIVAGVLAAMITVLATLLARARQPAATATTLLIALGIMRTWKSAVMMMIGVLLITALGEPLRLWRIRSAPPDQMSGVRKG